MKTSLFILLFSSSVLSFPTFCDEFWVTKKNSLPAEFSYLLEALQKTDFTENEKRSFTSQLKELDAEFSSMTKEEIFLLIKGEIYKSLLTYYKESSDTLLEKEQVELLEKNLQEKGPRLNAFALWLMIALKTDATTLINHPQLGQLKVGAQNKDLLRLKKKMNVISPWIQNFLSMSPDEFHNELRPILWEIFSRVERGSRLFSMLGRLEKKDKSEGPLKFFIKESKAPENLFPELDQWLQKEKSKKDEALELPPKSWKPKEKAGEDSYVAPKVLPKPIDDWLDQSEWNRMEKDLLKTPKTETNTPKVLPKPVNDWILDD